MKMAARSVLGAWVATFAVGCSAAPHDATSDRPTDESAYGLAAGTFVFATVDDGTFGSEVNGIGANTLAGDYTDSAGNSHGFVWMRGRFTTFVAPAMNRAVSSQVNGINASGGLVGNWQDPDGRNHGYLFGKGAFTTLGVPDADSADLHAQALNAQGQVVGFYNDTRANTHHGFLWKDGAFTKVDVPDAVGPHGTSAEGINDSGDVVGTFVDSRGGRHGFLLSKGVYTTLDVPTSFNGNSTVAQQVNTAGQIVGFYADASAVFHGFLLNQGNYTSVDVSLPGAKSTQIFSVDAQGEIVGAYLDSSGGSHGFLGRPGR
jgi:probable HAF family extracellular repeat protein